MKKEPPVTLYHHDTLNCSCIVLEHDGGDLFKLYMAEVEHDGKCPDLCHSDMIHITKRQITSAIDARKRVNDDNVEFKVNGHTGEFRIRRVEEYLEGVGELLKIHASWDKRKKRK